MIACPPDASPDGADDPYRPIAGLSASAHPAGNWVHWRGHRLFGQTWTPVTWRIGRRARMIRVFPPARPQNGVLKYPPAAGPHVTRKSGPRHSSTSAVARSG